MNPREPGEAGAPPREWNSHDGARLEDRSPVRMLAALLAANFLLRLALLPLNSAEYTDGVLQVTQFDEPTALWPPLYGMLAQALGVLVGGPLWGGRLISILAGALGMLPLWWIARRIAGVRAAFYVALLYAVAPVSLRWSPRMMSDALFATLFWSAVAAWLAVVLRAANAPAGCASPSANSARAGEYCVSRKRDRDLALAVLATALAMLSRYQGVLLAPLMAVTWLGLAWRWVQSRRKENFPTGESSSAGAHAFPWRTVIASLALAAAPAWARWRGVAHGEQFSDRLGADPLGALGIISLNGEAFLLLTPFFLTYPVALWVLVGLFRNDSSRANATARDTDNAGDGAASGDMDRCASDVRWKPARGPMLVATVYVGLAVILLQASFSSFQERYLLPWLGLLWVWGGVGMAAAQDAWRARPRLFSAAAGITLAWSALFAGAVLLCHREAFGDFAHAGRWLRENTPQTSVIYSNEIYNPNLGGQCIATNKMRFFSGHDVRYLPPPTSPQTPPPDLPSGAFVCLHSVYANPWTEGILSQRYRLEPVFDAQSQIVPLFPDIMARPGVAQNPTAWIWRYEPQPFATAIYRVTPYSP